MAEKFSPKRYLLENEMSFLREKLKARGLSDEKINDFERCVSSLRLPMMMTITGVLRAVIGA